MRRDRSRPRAPRPPAARQRGPPLRERRRPRARGSPEARPRVVAILSGPPAWRGRGRLGRLAAWLARGGLVRIPWEEVAAVKAHVELRKTAAELGLGKGTTACGRSSRGFRGRRCEALRPPRARGARRSPDTGCGRVHDVRGELKPRSLRVTGLVVGELGLLERLGIGAPAKRDRLRRRRDRVERRRSRRPAWRDREGRGQTDSFVDWRLAALSLRGRCREPAHARRRGTASSRSASAGSPAAHVDNRPRERLPVEDGYARGDARGRRASSATRALKAYAVAAGGVAFAVLLFDLEHGSLAAVIEADLLGQAADGRGERRRGEAPRPAGRSQLSA